MQPVCCRWCVCVFALFLGPLVSLASPDERVNTEGFAMDTAVFPEKDSIPILQTTTVFQDRRAYDVVHGASSRIACFDFEAQEVLLLELDQEKKTSIPFAELLRFQLELRQRAARREGLAAFLADPKFIREFDASNSTIRLSSPWLKYEAKGRTSTYNDVARFVDFADWAARLGGMLSPTAPPAGARIELNQALKRQNWLVEQITRSGGPRARALGTIRSKHEYRNELSASDLALIQDAQKGLKEFEQISFSEFRKIRNSTGAVTKK